MKYFVSYTTRTENNIQWAMWVEWVLRALGHETIMQKYDFQPGENFKMLMDKALIDADYTVGILSNEYLQSTNCAEEWTNADAQGKFIPIRFDNCNPKGLLHCKIYIDLCNKDKISAKEELGKRLRKPVRPTSEPDFPIFSPKTPEPDFPIWEDTDAAHERRLEFLENYSHKMASTYRDKKKKAELKVQTIVTLGDSDRYYLADKAILGDITYFLANKLDSNDELTDESAIFEMIQEEDSIYLDEVQDKKTLNKVATIFTMNFINEVENMD